MNRADGGADDCDDGSQNQDEDPAARATLRVKPLNTAVEQIAFQAAQLEKFLAADEQPDRKTQELMVAACHAPLRLLLDILSPDAMKPSFLRQ